ncbi:DUF952 domain-containing protein [Streptomyces xiaopingdaonensis]|uniref:DUF952 domain-containing protein n=1 Tax=Streptomyces xiaopingdaonensis TaxID=1565415 RepID=UPI000309D3F3|nr:DUF952 domain-containing protein [Streptomyces xiaopingdaonensis]
MTELLHLTERGIWEAARTAGVYRHSTRGSSLEEVGFIHASLPHQLPTVAALLYGSPPERDDLLVLVVDDQGLDVRYEAAEPGGEEFPHLYGPLPLDAVLRVEPWRG